MKKSLILGLLAMTMAFTGCSGAEETATTAPDSNAYDVRVIIKATDSDYWQTLLLGAEAAAAESGGKIEVITAGPTSEIDIDEQVAILENTVAAEPDAIVIASTSSDATVPAVEQAMASGIPVITVDNRLNTDSYVSFLATDHYLAAGMAAEAMVKEWEERGIDPNGKSVFVISSVAGTAVNTARTEGFINKIKELVPAIEVLETQYGDNDIATATDITLNTIFANENLIGIFGDNNHMGIGVANAINETGMMDSIVSYAFDSSPDEIAAIEAGTLTGIVVQDPYGMGYNGVQYAVDAIEGKEVEKEVVVPTTLVTLDNIQEEAVQALLYPGQ